MKQTCENCRWWDIHGAYVSAYCKAHAPVISNGETTWPTTGNGDFCGDFHPNEEYKEHLLKVIDDAQKNPSPAFPTERRKLAIHWICPKCDFQNPSLEEGIEEICGSCGFVFNS